MRFAVLIVRQKVLGRCRTWTCTQFSCQLFNDDGLGMVVCFGFEKCCVSRNRTIKVQVLGSFRNDYLIKVVTMISQHLKTKIVPESTPELQLA